MEYHTGVKKNEKYSVLKKKKKKRKNNDGIPTDVIMIKEARHQRSYTL